MKIVSSWVGGLAAVFVAVAASCCAAPVTTLFEDNFDQGQVQKPHQVPAGWDYYVQWEKGGKIAVLPEGRGRAVRLDDVTDGGEIGICRTFAYKPGHRYRVSLEARQPADAPKSAFFLQLTFYRNDNSRPLNASVALVPESSDKFTRFYTELVAPDNARLGRVYLYSGKKPVGSVIVDNCKLEETAGEFPPPPKDPARDFHALTVRPRELYLNTPLVTDGRAVAAIVVPSGEAGKAYAATLNAAIRAKTGIELPVVPGDRMRAFDRLDRNYIMVGNRDDNPAIEQLYYQHHVILDATYPGKGGSVVRSCHNPLGDKHNVIFAGGSDAAGTAAAVAKLAGRIKALPAGRSLDCGQLTEVQLPSGTRIADNPNAMPVWDGTFGWNRISKVLALLYATNDKKYADEFLRLAFPTPEVVKLLAADDEDYDDARDPLVKPYHYRSIRMMLYWDMVEESPYFTDAQRAAVSAKFYDQLNFWRTFGYQGGYKVFDNPQPHTRIADRHYLWEALSVYVVARYFDMHYPCLDSRVAMQCMRNIFAPLKRSAAMEIGTMMWYSTFSEPVVTYATLAGGREYENSPVLKVYGDTLLSHSDFSKGDWAMSHASAAYLGQLAALLGDQAFVDQIKLKSVAPDVFRLGQSYWPARKFARNSAVDNAGKFTHPEFCNRDMEYPFLPGGMKEDDVIEFESYRQKADGSGDFLLLDTKYETGGRNPFHNFNIVNFRLGGAPVLRGYGNQLQIYRDGIATGRKSFYTQVGAKGHVGKTAYLSGLVRDFNDHDWTRTLVLRDGKFLLAVDRVVPRSNTQSSLVENGFESLSGCRQTVSPFGEFHLLGRSRIPVKSETVPVSMDSADLLSAVDYPGKYFSGFLGCAGFNDVGVGQSIQIPFTLEKATRLKLSCFLVSHNGYRGKLRFKLDGKVVSPEVDHHAQSYTVDEVKLCDAELAAGKHVIEIEVTAGAGATRSSLITMLGVAGMTPDYDPEMGGYLVGTSAGDAATSVAPVSASIGSSGSAMRFSVDRPGKKGEAIEMVSMLRPGKPDARRPALAEDGKVVALKLPAPALLSRDGEGFTLLESDRIFGFGVKSYPGLFSGDQPVAFEYDAATRTLMLADAAGKVTTRTVDFKLPSTADLQKQVEAILARRRPGSAFRLDVPMRQALRREKLGAAIGTLVAFQAEGKTYFAAAAGREVRIYDATGKAVRTLELPAIAGAVCYYAQPGLLVVGCRDEKVIAFRLNGEKVWEFTSEMAKELAESAKYYWFKSALPGIYSLTAGTLEPGGKELLFVGSAGTVEVLDAAGKLQGRFWNTWGAVTEMALIPAWQNRPAELLSARMMGGWPDSYGIVSQQGKLSSRRRGMTRSIDNTDMGSFGFSSIGRYAIKPLIPAPGADPAIAGVFNGSQNHLMLWKLDGTVLADAELGPGRVANGPRYGLPALSGRNSTALEVTDLDGDGKPELVLAYFRNAVMAFDHQLKTRWIARLPEPPTVLAIGRNAAGEVRIAAGTRGRIWFIDPQGKVLSTAEISGTPASALALGDRLWIGTDNGTLGEFAF